MDAITLENLAARVLCLEEQAALSQMRSDGLEHTLRETHEIIKDLVRHLRPSALSCDDD
jgi:hypothetical protein